MDESSSTRYEPLDIGIVKRVLVMATLITSDYTDKTPDEQVRSVLDQPWYLVEDMRMPAKAKQIAEIAMDLTTTRHRAQFGNVMEPLVADSFDRKVLKVEQPPQVPTRAPRRTRTRQRPAVGRTRGSDLLRSNRFSSFRGGSPGAGATPGR